MSLKLLIRMIRYILYVVHKLNSHRLTFVTVTVTSLSFTLQLRAAAPVRTTMIQLQRNQ